MPPMFLLELFATMRARRRSAHRYNEEGAEITRRLLELLDATQPKQVETLSGTCEWKLAAKSETTQEKRKIAAWFRQKYAVTALVSLLRQSGIARFANGGSKIPISLTTEAMSAIGRLGPPNER